MVSETIGALKGIPLNNAPLNVRHGTEPPAGILHNTYHQVSDAA